jgi:hypothetical protein
MYWGGGVEGECSCPVFIGRLGAIVMWEPLGVCIPDVLVIKLPEACRITELHSVLNN